MSRPISIVAAVALAVVAAALMGACALPAAARAAVPGQTLEQAISDRAQGTTIAFSGLAVITGNLDAQSFFPPGKLADYWGFQELRDNDPSDMGHNTSFLTRVACDMLYVLDASQVEKLKALASSQVSQINEYGYKRYPLMKAFRRLVDGDLPAGSAGLDLAAVKAASSSLYVLDGQISYDRAVVYADIFRSLSADQKASLDAMVGKGWSAWPDKTMEDVRGKTAGLSQDESVAVMTYAGDMYSWYAGNITSDVYFCPERHGTYYGGFYIKDAPAIGHEGYSIDEQLTATAGSALCDSTKGYVTAAQAQLVSSLVDTQRDDLYAGTSNIVQARTDISTALRSLITGTAPSAAELAVVKATVLAKSAEYGALDGEDNCHYATAFAQLRASLSDAQLTKLTDLRKSILSGAYADGTPYDFTTCTTPFLFSAVIADVSLLDPYISDTDYLFGASPARPAAAFSYLPARPLAGRSAVKFVDASTGAPSAWSWAFGDGETSSVQNPSHVYLVPGTYTVSLTATGEGGSDTISRSVTVSPACTISGVALTQSPFCLRIKGTRFQSGCRVLIDGRVVAATLYRSATLLLARGSGLAAKLPKGIAVQIVVRNPDGGRSAPFDFTR